MKLGPISARRVARWLVARRYLLLVAGAIAAIACLQPAGELQFDRSVENMFADDDPVLPAFARLKRVFRAGDVVLAAYDDPQLMTPAGMDRVARVAGDMQKVPGVEAVSGLHGLGGRLGPLSDDLQKLLVGFTHSADGQTAALICFLRPDADAGATLAAMREVIQREGGVLAGETVMINDGFRYLEEDGRRLGWISTALLAATIIYCFRSIRWVIVPIAVVQLSLLATRATLALSGYRLSMVSSMLTSIVTVVAVAAVMRVIIGFRDGRAEGRSPRAALVAALYVLIVPTSWSCVTDALGFGSLLVAEVGPVRDFGLMTALGCLWALAALVLLVPGLALIGGVDTDPRRVWGENVLDVWLSRMVNVASSRPRTVALLCIAATAFLAAGAARLDVETDFTKNFRAASPIARSYDFVETQLGGAGMWDVLVPAPRTLDDAYLARLRRLARRLRTEAGVELEATRGLTGVLAISDVLDTLPLRGFTRFKLAALHRLTPQLYRSLYAEDPDEPGRFYCRIMLRARERESAEAKRELIATVERIAAEEFPAERAPHGGGPEVTGYYVLLTKMIDSVLRDQWFTFGVSAASIAIVLVIAFRSLGFAIAAMVPNLLPVFAVLGLLGWSGLKMNMGAAMIAAVSLGLSVNSSIHYIAIFNHARRRGKTLGDALDEAQQSIGRASVFATLALVIGFSALCLSEFIPTVYFGALVALALFGGLLGNLVILPLLLVWIDRKPKPQGDGSRFRNDVSQ